MKTEMFNFIDVYTSIMGSCTTSSKFQGSFNTYEKAKERMYEVQDEFGGLGECLIHDTIEQTEDIYIVEDGRIIHI